MQKSVEEPPKLTPWYRDFRYAMGIGGLPAFFFADHIVRFISPNLSNEQAKHIEQAIQFFAGAFILLALTTLFELITNYYEINFLLRYKHNDAFLRSGLVHASISSLLLLVLTLFILTTKDVSDDYIRIVQVSIAGSIVVSILFNLGGALYIGGLNIKKNKGAIPFSSILAKKDISLLTLAIIIISVPTLASTFNVSPSFLDTKNYQLPTKYMDILSVYISVTLLFSYFVYLIQDFSKFGKIGPDIDNSQSDTEENVIKIIIRAINKVFVSKGEISLYDALKTPYIYYAKKSFKDTDEERIQKEMDELDYMLEKRQIEEEHLDEIKDNERKRIAQQKKPEIEAILAFPFRLLVGLVLILISPVILIARLLIFPITRRNIIIETGTVSQQDIPKSEEERRSERNSRSISQKFVKSTREPISQTIQRLILVYLGGAAAIYILSIMAHDIEGGLVIGLGINPFFVGFILIPVATGLGDLIAATKQAWENNLQGTLAITTGSAVQSAMVVGPLLVLISRLSFLGIPHLNLVFGLFVLVIFGLITYFYKIITEEGAVTWYEGAQLLAIFTVIALVFYFVQPATP